MAKAETHIHFDSDAVAAAVQTNLEQIRRVYLTRVEGDIQMMFDLLKRFADGRPDAALDHLLRCMDNSDTLGAHTSQEEWALVGRAKAALPMTRPYPQEPTANRQGSDVR